jgi:hypothetical protein
MRGEQRVSSGASKSAFHRSGGQRRFVNLESFAVAGLPQSLAMTRDNL